MSSQKYVVVSFCLSFICVLLATKCLAVLENNNEHGKAHWATKGEIHKLMHKSKLSACGLYRKPSRGGMVIKKIGNTIWHEMEAIHTMVIGTTSSGKTRKTLIPSIMIASESKYVMKKKIIYIIKNEKAFQHYIRRKSRFEDSILCVLLHKLFSFKNTIKQKLEYSHHFIFCSRKVIKVGDTFNLEKYFSYQEMNGTTFAYKCKSSNIKIVDQKLTALKKGKARVKLSLTIDGDSFFVNDPKKELYRSFHYYLKDKGYNVILLDLRKPWTGDCWNPMTSVIKLIDENKYDEAEMFARDIATALVPDNKASEKLWTDGERSVITALILIVASSDCDEEQKNLYSCYQILSTLGQPRDDDSVPLNDYFNALPIDHIARKAFGAVALSTDRTRMSFYVSAATTLSLFSSSYIAKQTCTSNFDITSFSSNKTAVFMVVPDEKDYMNPLASLFIDEIYRVLSMVSTNLESGTLLRRFHYFIDEFGSLCKISGMQKKAGIARGKNQLFHLYVQDYGQIEEIYGKEVCNTLKANCNLLIYISTQLYSTAEEISKMTGTKTIITNSTSENTGGSIFFTEHGSKSKSLMGQPLISAYDLMHLKDGQALIIRMRMSPLLTKLEDCSYYEFFKNLKQDLEESPRLDNQLTAYIPDLYEQKRTFTNMKKV